MSDYQIRFEPVAGTGPGRLYTINDKPDLEAAIKLAKIRHTMDFGFANVSQRIVTTKIFDEVTRSWIFVSTDAEV
jgi:hypothetical protein